MDGATLVLDLGSSRMRCSSVADSHPVRPVEIASAPYPIIGAGSGGLARSFNPRLLRTRLFDVLAKAAREVGPGNVETIAVVGQRCAACFFDTELRTVYAGPQTDIRAVFEGGAIDEEHGPLVHATAGHLPSLMLVPAKLRWWRTHRPRAASRIAKASGLDAWAALQLTGSLAETPHGLAELGLLDVSARAPATGLLDTLGIPMDILPCLLPLGAAAGRLTRDAADATGLSSTVEVRLAGPDAQAAAVGSGAVSDGSASVPAGWSAPAQVTTAASTFDPRRRTWTTLHSVDGRWVVEGNPGDTGGAVDIIRRLLGPRVTPARFDALAANAPETTRVVAAFLGPRALDLSNPGMTMGGLLSPVPITQEGLDSGTVARAALENVAFAIRESLSLAREVVGQAYHQQIREGGEVPAFAGMTEGSGPLSSSPPQTGERTPSLALPRRWGREPEPADAVALSGGMAESSVFPGLLADVLGEPVRIHRKATAIGAVMIATTPPLELAARSAALAAEGEFVEPGEGSLEANELYERWLRLCAKLDGLAGEL